jgi:hypothetical protein
VVNRRDFPLVNDVGARPPRLAKGHLIRHRDERRFPQGPAKRSSRLSGPGERGRIAA